MNRKEQAQKNREQFPTVAGVVAQFRDVFGADQVRVTYAEENGRSIGEKPKDGLGDVDPR